MKYKDFIKNQKECPFCHPKQRIILELKECFMTYNLWPYHKHHILVVPKRHVESLVEVTESEMKEINTLQVKALDIMKKLGHKDISQLVKEGVNKTIKHVHFHTIPCTLIGDLDSAQEERAMLSDEEVAKTVKDISKFI